MPLAGHVGRPPPLERAIDPVQSQAPAAPSIVRAGLNEMARESTPSFPGTAAIEPQVSFAEELHTFIDQIATEVSLSHHEIAAEDAASIASDGSSSHVDAAASSAANNRSRDLALKRLLEPLIKNVPSASQPPLAGLVLPPPPAIAATHLALRNVSGAYLVDAPCASRPSPHFSISKSPLRSPRSLSPLAKMVERLTHSLGWTISIVAMGDDATAAKLLAGVEQHLGEIATGGSRIVRVTQ